MADDAKRETPAVDRAAFVLAAASVRASLIPLLARRLSGDTHAAEDVLQNALLKTWERVVDGGYDHRRGGLPTYITAVAMKMVAKVYRKRASQRTLATDDAVCGVADLRAFPVGTEAIDPKLVSQKVRAAISNLRNRNQQVVVWRWLRGQSYAFIAEIMGTTPGTVSRWAMRARQQLARDRQLEMLWQAIRAADRHRG